MNPDAEAKARAEEQLKQQEARRKEREADEKARRLAEKAAKDNPRHSRQ